jgi:ATP-dependent Lon protease
MPVTNKFIGSNKKQNGRTNLKKSRPDPESSESESEYETVSESDSSYKPPSKKSKKRQPDTSESEDIEESDEESDEEEEEEEDDASTSADGVVNRPELQKLLSKLFPSKYLKNKIENTFMDAVDTEISKKKKDSKKKTHKKSKKYESESEEEDDEEEEFESARSAYNILFIDGAEEDEEEEYVDEDEDVECNSDDEQTFMKEKYEKVDTPKKQEIRKHKSKKSKKSSAPDDADADATLDDATLDDAALDVEQEYLDLVDTKKQLTEQLQKKPNNKVLIKAINNCNDSIKKLVKKARTTNAKIYHDLVYGGKKQANEVDYFKKKLSNKEQLRVMKDLKEINSYINIERPYRLSLLESTMPAKFKATALQKLAMLRDMEPGDNEYYKIKNWVDAFMRIPFGRYKSLSVKMSDGIEVCHGFMERAMQTLDECVYGLNDAKMQIIQMIGQWIANPDAMGSAIAIKGPPGTGKTSLVRDGISKILGREFAFIALGGTGDSSFLEGHGYTYEGSSWGKIVQILIDSKCMNPVIFFDELDKISETPRGEEIVGILTHLTDSTQNSQFHDKYFSEIDFDISKCLFIFSYNDESKVNPILKDRMYQIKTKGYDTKEKVVIARDYLLPKIREQVNFTAEDVITPDDVIAYIASNKVLTKEEAGVRNLKRCLEIIHTKLNLFRLIKPDANLFGKEIELKVEFPFTVTKQHVDLLIKNDEHQNQSMLAMYV